MQKITRKEQKEKTRTSLIRQAEKLFSERGIYNTTTADIASSMGLSHGTVFVHFGTRDDLVKAVVDEFGERLAESLGERCSDSLKLKELLTAHVNVLGDFEDFYMRLISESQTLPPHIRSIVYAMNASISYRLFRAAKSEMDQGEIKKMTQVQLFNTWMATLNYQIMNRDLFSEKLPILKDTGESLLKHFLFLIKT